MFGFSADKFILIAIAAVVIVGPQRLPAYAAKLAKWVKAVRVMLDGAKDRMNEELGPEVEDIDWKNFDAAVCAVQGVSGIDRSSNFGELFHIEGYFA